MCRNISPPKTLGFKLATDIIGEAGWKIFPDKISAV
jgi:hypothetical protein